MAKSIVLMMFMLVGCGSTPAPQIDHAAINVKAMRLPMRKPATAICPTSASSASNNSSRVTSPTYRYTPVHRGFCDRAAVQAVVAANASELTACYEAALEANPVLAGKVKMLWRIQLDGSVTIPTVIGFSLQDEPTMRCICAAISTWVFPKPNGGICEIKYPFHFLLPEDDSTPPKARSTPPAAL